MVGDVESCNRLLMPILVLRNASIGNDLNVSELWMRASVRARKFELPWHAISTHLRNAWMGLGVPSSRFSGHLDRVSWASPNASRDFPRVWSSRVMASLDTPKLNILRWVTALVLRGTCDFPVDVAHIS